MFRFYRQPLTLFCLILSLIAPPAVHAAPAAVAPGPLLGFHIAQGDAAHLQAVRAAGGRFAVLVFSWADIEPLPNTLYWEKPDAALRAAAYDGVEIVARLDQAPAWARTPQETAPWDVDAYAGFARRVVQRYGDRLGGVILWNEPNLSLEWDGRRPEAAAYVAMLRAAYPAVKVLRPQLPVLLAGLASTTGDGTRAVDDLAYLRAIYAAGGAAYFDILAAHPYGFGQPPEQAPAAARLNFRRLELLREIMVANNDGDKPVWITEMGWRTSAPAPADAWQVVSEERQAIYTSAAIDAAAAYPWLTRLALWELNGALDAYGYSLWSGPDATSPAYEALVARCQQTAAGCPTAPPAGAAAAGPVSILAPDVAIRLGDIGTLHPHWVHLYQGGERFSPRWEGEFFLGDGQANQAFDLLLETMQIDQPTNTVAVNGQTMAYLRPRTRPDPTSTWVTQRFSVPAGLLRAGVNRLRVSSGQRNPVWQYGDWRWENMQFRNVRLVPRLNLPAAPLAWQALPSPPGWVETNRLRAAADGSFWLTGNRAGQLWQGEVSGGRVRLRMTAGGRPDLVYHDVLPLLSGELAATNRGLFWRDATTGTWQPVAGAPQGYAYVTAYTAGYYYAGYETVGLWRARDPMGPWTRAGLAGQTVLDLAVRPDGSLAVATADGVYVQDAAGWYPWRRLPAFPARAGDRFTSRLFAGAAGELVARQRDRWWRWREETGWQAFGPPGEDRVYALSGCCAAGVIAGGAWGRLWRLQESGSWQRLDDGSLDPLGVTGLLYHNGRLLAATDRGLYASTTGRTWRAVDGPPAAISDLWIDPAAPGRWLAATPAGMFGSTDRGQTWQAVSRPWNVWDMAFGPSGRLFLARSSGLAWSDDVRADPIVWHDTQGMDSILFFSANPNPRSAAQVWAGSWGNDVGVSADAGQTIGPLHHGLETLSVLDVMWHAQPGQVTVATIEGLYRSDNGGESWFKLPGPLAQQTVHRLLLGADGALWAAAADGLWVSHDGGAAWRAAAGLSGLSILRLGSLQVGDETWLWAGSEEAGLWTSRDGGAGWEFAGLAGDSIYHLLVDPQDGQRLIAATSRGLLATQLAGRD